ncbi:MAG: protein phosphatase 2C domain-containing protein, partial [Bacteroidales bacterium]|nr:protein phosphatase 2C domain-containing protein [Bacteroidales bacterium]
MKQFISLFVFTVLFTTSIFAQKVEGEQNQKHIMAIFDTAQVKIYYQTSYYILKIGISEEKVKEIAKEINIHDQLNALKSVSPTAYNCLILAKYPKAQKDTLTKLYVKNNTNAVFVNGLNINSDISSLNLMISNIVKYLENISGDGTIFPYKANLNELKLQLENIVKKAKTDAENYQKSDEYKNNLPTQDNTNIVDENQIVDNIPEVDTDKEAWETAKKENTIQSYQKYLTDFREGKYVSNANDKIVELQNKQEENAWKTAKDANTIKAFNIYITKYPEGKYVNKANEEIKKLEGGGEPKPNYLIYILVFLTISVIVILLFVNLKNKKKLKEKEAEIKRIEAEKLKIQAMQNANSKVNTENNTVDVTKTNTLVPPIITSKPETKPIKLPIGLKGDWTIVGASVIGKSHVEMNKPCQDSHAHIMLNAKWGIAVTSDGAGSAKLSDIGSKAVSKMAATIVFKKIVEENNWHNTNKLPSQTEWEKIAKKGMLEIYAGLKQYAAKNNYVLTDLACTVIVNIFSPIGLLVTHIGDGRAGYRTMDGEWKASIIPHSGEESNQTIFITSAPWIADKNFTMSGVSVPESRVINEKISAFTSMSDGGEAHLFESSKIDPITQKWSDPNKPASLFDK